MTNFIIEGGLVFEKISGESDPVESVEKTKEIFAAETDNTLDIIVYEGFECTHSGGRTQTFTANELKPIVDDLNTQGIEFCLALNGGLRFSSDPGLDDSEKDFLEQMDKVDVRNKVVITSPELLYQIRDAYPNLNVISSCIQHLNIYSHQTYDDMFRNYDLVVPLNQHATHRFLSQYQEHADQMLVLLTLACGSRDFTFCYHDYLKYEKGETSLGLGSNFVVKFGLEKKIPSQLDLGDRGCKHEKSALINRPYDIKGLINMGVTKYKVPRSEQFEPGNFHKFIGYVNEASKN